MTFCCCSALEQLLVTVNSINLFFEQKMNTKIFEMAILDVPKAKVFGQRFKTLLLEQTWDMGKCSP
jgi:hypothetical protein